MKNLKKLSDLSIFMVGIGGISMSGLCKLLISRGCNLIGSDTCPESKLSKLKDLGVVIYHNHSSDNVNKNIDLLVYSGAIKKDNPEIVMAKKLHIPVIERSKLLGWISQLYSNVISVAGTHGKTTTSSMIAHVFQSAGLCPTIHLGGECNNFNDSTVIGKSDYFIVESCEYRNSFRYLKPTLGVILNIENDHLDYYRNLKHIYKCFANYARKSKSILISKDVNLTHKNCEIVNQDWKVMNINANKILTNFDVYYKTVFFGTFKINMIGLHNVYNALFTIAVANYFDIDKQIVLEALNTFTGVKRRYENIGQICDIPIIIDYAHHPTEISTSVNGLKSVYDNILYVFQPHTYSRTKTLMNDFVTVLSGLNNITIFKTFPAREDEIIGGRCIDLFNKINNLNKVYFSDINNLVSFIKDNTFKYDAVLILGAGDLGEIIKSYLD